MPKTPPLTLLLALLAITLTADCSSRCVKCSSSSEYACRSCPITAQPFLTSCPQPTDEKLFIAIAAILLTLHLFMLAMGLGIYRQLYEHIQFAAIIQWRYSFGGGTSGLVLTNLALITDNNFINIYGPQFICALVAIGVFWMVLAMADRIPHSPTAMLVRRKRVIFPTRIITLSYTMVVYAGLAEITTVDQENGQEVFGLILGIMGLIAAGVALLWLAIVANQRRLQPDDPNYYVFLQQMTSKKWYARNNLLLFMMVRLAMLGAFTGMFSIPNVAGILMVLLQIAYTFYFVGLIRFRKLRYMVVLVSGNVLLVGVILSSYIGSISELGGGEWSDSGTAYKVMLLLLCVLYFMGGVVQLLVRREQVVKQLRSIWCRFILCEKLQQKVIVSKYDENSHREKVTQFHANLLYRKDNQVQLPNMQ